MSAALRIPREVADEAAQALSGERDPTGFRQVTAMAGGCIHPAARVETSDGRVGFLKWSPDPGHPGFGVEARGLEALAAQGGLRVPSVLGVGTGTNGSRGWLLLEFIEPAPVPPTGARDLGVGLARLHRPIESAAPGWTEDGWIGSLPQPNAPDTRPSWPGFWRDRRLLPLRERVSDHFDSATHARWDHVLEQIDTVLEGWADDGLTLLHGDLWHGNVLWDRDGRPVLIDPAVYLGHREVDLAMMELFGGFDAAVLESYQGEAPLVPGYVERRRDLYQLYPLLVHLVLFGTGYAAGVRDRIDRLYAWLR